MPIIIVKDTACFAAPLEETREVIGVVVVPW